MIKFWQGKQQNCTQDSASSGIGLSRHFCTTAGFLDTSHPQSYPLDGSASYSIFWATVTVWQTPSWLKTACQPGDLSLPTQFLNSWKNKRTIHRHTLSHLLRRIILLVRMPSMLQLLTITLQTSCLLVLLKTPCWRDFSLSQGAQT